MSKLSTLPGPVFEAGPGWGERLGQWIKNNWTTKLFPAIAVVVLLAGIAQVYSQPKNQPTANKENPLFPSLSEEISATIQKGDGVITVSRRALNIYLEGFSEIQLKPEERLQIDNYFKNKYDGLVLTIGQKMKFLKADLEQAINEARQLPEGKRQKLRTYLQ